MKNIFKICLLAFISLIVISCDKDEDIAILNNTANSSLSSNKTTVVLDELVASQSALTFNFTEPVFTPNVMVSNTLEFSVEGKNFSPKVSYAIANSGNTVSLTHLEVNNLMAALEIDANVQHNIEVRLNSSINAVNSYYSNIVKIQITPYMPNPDLIYPKINVPGGYAGAAGYADWNPANSPNLFSPDKNDKYRGFVYVTNPNSEYKFTINQDWAGDKGDDGTFTGKLLETGEQNIKAVTGGTYYINVNWTANTYSSVIANFGVIGDATPTGWGSDTDFVYNPATKTFVINSIALTSTGVFKFRANNAWDMKFQPASANEALVSGKAVKTYLSSEGTVTNDPGYQVSTSGNYKIELDLHNSAYYKLTVTKL